MSVEPRTDTESPAPDDAGLAAADGPDAVGRLDVGGRTWLTPLRVFSAAFAVLVLSGASVAIANFNAGQNLFAWTSVGLSAAAAVLSIASLFIPLARKG